MPTYHLILGSFILTRKSSLDTTGAKARTYHISTDISMRENAAMIEIKHSTMLSWNTNVLLGTQMDVTTFKSRY